MTDGINHRQAPGPATQFDVNADGIADFEIGMEMHQSVAGIGGNWFYLELRPAHDNPMEVTGEIMSIVVSDFDRNDPASFERLNQWISDVAEYTGLERQEIINIVNTQMSEVVPGFSVISREVQNLIYTQGRDDITDMNALTTALQQNGTYEPSLTYSGNKPEALFETAFSWAVFVQEESINRSQSVAMLPPEFLQELNLSTQCQPTGELTDGCNVSPGSGGVGKSGPTTGTPGG